MTTDTNKIVNEPNKLRLAVLQRVCPGYRVTLFTRLTSSNEINAKLFIGDSIPNSKVNNAVTLDGIRMAKLKTRFIRFGKRVLPWHVGLIKQLKSFDPDVILCEGESNFLGYLQAIWYKTFIKKVGLIHWCFISLPGEPLQKPGIGLIVKRYTRKFFDAFLLYSSFSKTSLLKLGIKENKAFVATNVGDVGHFIGLADSLTETASNARLKLNLPEKFTVLYTGTLDRNKRPEMLLELARLCDPKSFNFVLLGGGEMFEELTTTVNKKGLSNVYLPGKVSSTLALYYKASDVLLVPGRGGIVISEGMAYSLPVITHQADGTEYDLIRNDETGFILNSGDVDSFRQKVEWLKLNKEQSTIMGKAGRQLVQFSFTTNNMVSKIIEAAAFTKKILDRQV